MLITYAINRSIIVALDKKVKHLVVKIFDQDKNYLADYEFFQTDFAKIDFNTIAKMLLLELIMDDQKERRKIFFN